MTLMWWLLSFLKRTVSYCPPHEWEALNRDPFGNMGQNKCRKCGIGSTYYFGQYFIP